MDAFSINKQLITLYGRDPILDLPNYRVVRSETQTEKRTGNYNIFSGKIFLRNETGTIEVRKYEYLNPCWILEKLCITKTDAEFDITGERPYTYEPFFTFLDANDQPLELAWRPIELVISLYLRAERKFKTEEDHLAEEQAKIKKEEEHVKEVLFGNETNVTEALQYKEGVVVPSNYVGASE